MSIQGAGPWHLAKGRLTDRVTVQGPVGTRHDLSGVHTTAKNSQVGDGLRDKPDRQVVDLPQRPACPARIHALPAVRRYKSAIFRGHVSVTNIRRWLFGLTPANGLRSKKDQFVPKYMRMEQA